MKGYPFTRLRAVGQKIVQNFKDKSNVTLRLWTDHCEYILAQRFRRGQQISSFYYGIWGEHALRELLHGFRRQFQRHIKGVLLSSVGLYIFDWDSERMRLDSIKSYLSEIDFIERLKRETLICPKCCKRKIIGEKFDGIEYCSCPTNQCDCKHIKKLQGWEPYIERRGMIIWRREEKPSLFAYKVYAKYDDITASDFLHVQTDIEYRKQWDDTAISLEIVDTDPADKGRSHIIYWEMKWPKLFANRDYVYYRKHLLDRNRNVVVICSKSTSHPKCPINPNKQRVDDYWSYMVIKPYRSFDEPGLEFVLTYFDDPGLAIPSTITSWVAQKQMPEFLHKLYMATKKYAEHKKGHRSKLPTWGTLKSPAEYLRDSSPEKRDYQSFKKSDNSKEAETQIEGESPAQENTEITAEDQRKSSWWSYLHPNYYFA